MPSPELDVFAAAAGPFPIHATALAGINTPLSGFSVTDTGAAQVAVLLSVSNGVLYADTAPGAAVGGGGSGRMWIAGSAAQVNAKLATLVYASARPGADAIAVSVIDSLGQSLALANVPLQVLPLSIAAAAASALSFSGGTMTLDARLIDGLTLTVTERQGSAASPALVLTNSTIGASAHVSMLDESGPGGAAPRLAIAGQVDNDGEVSLRGGATLVTLAKNAVLTNTGRIEFLGSSAQVSGAGTLRNDGTLAVAGGGAAGARPLIAVAIVGNGVLSLGAGAKVEVAQSVAASQTIRFEDAPGQPEFLQLDHPADVQAQIAGFAPGDQILLTNTHFDAAAYTPTDASHGVLTLYDGAAVEASLRFAGDYQLSRFSLLSTGAGGPAPVVRITVSPSQGPANAGHAGVDVYRFFDQALGTQVLTQDVGERDAILSSRHDLVYEGVGLEALDPHLSDPAAIPVYRFFDTTNGTHFFTASDAERAGILATRPDLTFEPSSTIYEHAAPQAGDVPVFRFFDSAHGTHLYVADAGERAGLLSTRLDLRDEGVAFYAPAT